MIKIKRTYVLEEYQALMIDDEWESARLDITIPHFLKKYYINVDGETNGNKALNILRSEHQYEIILLDIEFKFQKLQGKDLFGKIKQENPDLPILMVSNSDDPEHIVDFLQRGAANYFAKGNLQVEKLALEIHNIVDLYREKKRNRVLTYQIDSTKNDQFMFQSNTMSHIVAQAEEVSLVDTSVLLLGESGTGKEMIASLIHKKSPRSKNNFLKINCSTISHTLAETTLFGHEAGAFTDAKKSKLGLFELANRGTLFLDEIAEMTLEIQAKLLRVLEAGIITRVGGQNERKVNVRIIAATNKNLHDLVKMSKFREDLYYRLNVYSINIPPLRERLGDLELLTSHFIKKANKKLGTNVSSNIENIISAIKSYRWPGNVRQLENAVEAAVINSRLQNAEKLTPEMFQVFYESPNNFFNINKADNNYLSIDNISSQFVDKTLKGDYDFVMLDSVWHDIMKDTLKRLIIICDGDGKKISNLLKVNRNKLSQILYRWGLKLRDYRQYKYLLQ